ncbi:MAG TPA: V-type ATPase subunit [Candidatus Acidoferrum sp.]|nr:V-type ATPase subunit [Candidatus Acidoferrum sp.]
MSQTTLYASVLARIGAERGKLLSEAKLKALTESKNLQEFAAQLRETSYQEQIAKLSMLTSRKLEKAFNENLIAVIAKIIQNSPKNAQKYLLTYIYRFEIENVKALIKATNANQSVEQKLAILYISAEDYLKNRAVIEEAAKAQTIKQLVNVLKRVTKYAVALSMGFQSYEEDGTTVCLDVLLDKVFHEEVCKTYENLPKKEKPSAFFYTSIENDGFTLMTLLRGKNLNYDANWLRSAVPAHNFKIYAEVIEEIVTAADFDSALKIVLESYYSGFFIRAKNPETLLADVERVIKVELLHHAKTSAISDNFSVGAALAFLTQKEAEVHNLCAISSGVEAQIKPEEIESQLFF